VRQLRIFIFMKSQSVWERGQVSAIRDRGVQHL